MRLIETRPRTIDGDAMAALFGVLGRVVLEFPARLFTLSARLALCERRRRWAAPACSSRCSTSSRRSLAFACSAEHAFPALPEMRRN
jgi:hypothetical protein